MHAWVKYSIVLAAVIGFIGVVLNLHTLAIAGGIYAAVAILSAFISHVLFPSHETVTVTDEDEAVFE